MAFGLYKKVTAKWKYVALRVRDSELHVPSLGSLDLPELARPVKIMPPAENLVTGKSPWTHEKPQEVAGTLHTSLLRLSFTNLKPGQDDDEDDDVLRAGMERAKRLGVEFSPPGVLAVAVETNNFAVWEVLLELFTVQIAALQLDKDTILDTVLLTHISHHLCQTLTQLIIVDCDDIADAVWPMLLSRLPSITRLYVYGTDAYTSNLHMRDLVAPLVPMAMFVAHEAQKWVQSGMSLVTNPDVKKWVSLHYVKNYMLIADRHYRL